MKRRRSDTARRVAGLQKLQKEHSDQTVTSSNDVNDNHEGSCRSTELSVGVRSRSPKPKSTPSSVDQHEASIPSNAVLDSLYRLMHRQPRSDQLQLRRCRFDTRLCERAADIFREDFTKNPLRRLALQVGCRSDEALPTTAMRVPSSGLHLFFPLIFSHSMHLRELDLSRNDLCSADVTTLCRGLGLGGSTESPLRLLDLSYNSRLSNDGVVTLFRSVQQNARLKAVLLRCVGLDDDGAVELAPLLRRRPPPRTDEMEEIAGRDRERHPFNFYVNFNENRVGPAGTQALGRGLPSYVSLSLCKQIFLAHRNRPAEKNGTEKEVRATPSAE